MIIVDITAGGHDWEKQSLVTKVKGSRAYDMYKCKHCGIEGKSYKLGLISVPEKYKSKVAFCTGPKEGKTSLIKVIHCRAFGPKFGNLADGSVHKIITPPEGFDNKRGEWVMGVDEPVLLLFNEFEYV